jgi:drug/metabolite transporter (DMT)-like permease
MSAGLATPAPVSSPRRMQWLRSKYLLGAFIAFMYVYVIVHNESFLVNNADPEWSHIATFKWFLLPHGLAAGCALLLGPFQFSERLRKRFTRVHRVMGRFYVGGVLLGAPIGLYIQHFESTHMYPGDPVQFSLVIATAADAAVWIFATVMAMVFILQRRTQLHRVWMSRSYACAIIFLEVRVIAGVFHIDDKFTEIIVWSCVAAAFPLADLVLQVQETLRTRTAAKPARAVAR